MPLTDLQCRSATCPTDKPRKRYADSLGLYLEVQPKGAKYWRLKYRYGGKEKRLALGTYPQVSLLEARKSRTKARDLLAEGRDPSSARKDEALAKQVAIAHSFESVARSWYAQWRAARTDHHADYVMRRLEADVFTAIGHLPVAEISAPKLIAMAKKIEARGALDIARRALQTCGQVLRFAVAHGLIERNPATDVRPGDALKSRQKMHYARIDVKEVPDLLRRIEVYKGGPYTRMALRLIALTFVRTSELIGARWDEFDLDAAEWRIPPERMKMRTPHVVPLSSQAIEVVRSLAELRNTSQLLFPGERDHQRPMSNNTLLKALEIMGYKHRMTGHGFRGIASTLLHEAGFEHAHIELQLAHTERNAVSAAYNFATYLPQRRRMMQWWADELDSLRKGASVVQMRASEARTSRSQARSDNRPPRSSSTLR